MTGESVWFIDDAPRTRRLLDDFLIMYAYDGRGFENAEDALAALGSGEPAPKAILCDLVLPGMNGDKFYEAAAEHLNGCAKYMITGHENILKTLVLPMDITIMIKPMDIFELRKSLAYKVRNSQ